MSINRCFFRVALEILTLKINNNKTLGCAAFEQQRLLEQLIRPVWLSPCLISLITLKLFFKSRVLKLLNSSDPLSSDGPLSICAGVQGR